MGFLWKVVDNLQQQKNFKNHNVLFFVLAEVTIKCVAEKSSKSGKRLTMSNSNQNKKKEYSNDPAPPKYVR